MNGDLILSPQKARALDQLACGLTTLTLQFCGCTALGAQLMDG